MIKSDQKEKIAKARKLIADFKIQTKRSLDPFLQEEDIQKFGSFDFKYVNKKFVSFQIIQQKFKTNKYTQVNQVIRDLKGIFQQVSYFVPLNDPLQQDCAYFLKQVDKIYSLIDQNQAIKPIISQRGRERERQRERSPKIKNYSQLVNQQEEIPPLTIKQFAQPRRSTLSQKLQMIYFLKSRATNHPLIRSIGDMYGIGRETEQEYIIKLDNSTHCNWLDVLQKKDQ